MESIQEYNGELNLSFMQRAFLDILSLNILRYIIEFRSEYVQAIEKNEMQRGFVKEGRKLAKASFLQTLLSYSLM